ncbi:MAG TPA: hypothetical protein VL651_03835 [Bacteroidia bacterium]|jgi:hypothetical protein|nr:hypothetical protein [Bacteroidia bacterium]
MKKFFLFLLVTAGVAFAEQASAQCDSTSHLCAKHIIPPFVSDGQTYRALVLSGQNAEFKTTFFQGSTYRIAAGSGLTEGNLIFSIYSEDPNTGERQLIFTNSQHDYAPYWDFKVNATVEVVIEASLNPSSGKDSGCAVMLIGFKQ